MPRKNNTTERIDAEIGLKIHELRLAMGLSRQQLASQLDVTHQQLTKYENGTNRISAGRLPSVAIALGQPISYFFQNTTTIPPTHHQRMSMEVSRNFLKITDPAHQIAINMLIRSLGGN